jgi:hypothetical protein
MLRRWHAGGSETAQRVRLAPDQTAGRGSDDLTTFNGLTAYGLRMRTSNGVFCPEAFYPDDVLWDDSIIVCSESEARETAAAFFLPGIFAEPHCFSFNSEGV